MRWTTLGLLALAWPLTACQTEENCRPTIIGSTGAQVACAGSDEGTPAVTNPPPVIVTPVPATVIAP